MTPSRSSSEVTATIGPDLDGMEHWQLVTIEACDTVTRLLT